ncbi:MAG: hypothetical protein ACYCTW_09185 [Sulfuricella sp.]
MATKTTSTTDNNAGCSPCTPEASKGQVVKARFPSGQEEEKLVTCEGCINLDKPEVGTGVAWCNFHDDYD